jgi:putative ABC transport system permease protein
VTVVGTTADWIEIRQFRLARGRFLNDGDDAGRARVVVLGASAKTSLFPDTIEATGRTVWIDRTPFEVIGVLEPKGVSIDGRATEDDRIFVPLQTAMRRLFNIDYIRTVYLEGVDASVLDQAEADAAALLRARHDITPGAADDFDIQNQRVLLETELATQASFRRLIAGLGLLALFVGGSGILSLMLLSVRERRHEIGLRIAVGARRCDIAVQFLAESLLLALTGGIAGITLGALAARVVARFSTWPAALSIEVIATAAAAAVITGTISGVLPAWRAASLDPVVGLRAQ